MATYSIIPWRIPWTGLAGYSPRGFKESDTTEATWHACTIPQVFTYYIYINVYLLIPNSFLSFFLLCSHKFVFYVSESISLVKELIFIIF